MGALWNNYLVPNTIQEALSITASYGGSARVVAGGTDLVPRLRRHELKTTALVDLTQMADLHYIKEEGDLISIGPLTTHTELAKSASIKGKSAALAEAAACIGSPQIRNVGTVGGNIVNAQPAADTAVALLALGAWARITGQGGERTLPLSAVYAGVGLSAVDSTREILTAIFFTPPPNPAGSAFERLAKRRALSLPILNVAVVVALEENKRCCRWARIAIAPVAPSPWRAEAAEAELVGKELSKGVIHKAADVAAAHAQPRDSRLRGSAVYRKEMVKVLVARALTRAARSGGAMF